MLANSVSSLAQTGLRTIVRAPKRRTIAPRAAARRGPGESAEPAIHDPRTMQKPADGRYASRSPKIVPVGNRRFAVGRNASARNRNPSADGERDRRRESDAIASAATRAGATQKSASRGVSLAKDQADSSDERRSGSAIRPRYRRRTAQALAARGPGFSGASGFSTSKIPVDAAP